MKPGGPQDFRVFCIFNIYNKKLKWFLILSGIFAERMVKTIFILAVIRKMKERWGFILPWAELSPPGTKVMKTTGKTTFELNLMYDENPPFGGFFLYISGEEEYN